MEKNSNTPTQLFQDKAKLIITDKAEAPDFLEAFYALFLESPPSGKRDISYALALIEDFGMDLDIFEELKNFHAWTLDRPNGGAFYPRSQFRRWLKRARSYKFHLGEHEKIDTRKQ